MWRKIRRLRYNFKFLTDIKGYAGLRKAIRSIHPSKELLTLADEGILISYRQIESHLLGETVRELQRS